MTEINVSIKPEDSNPKRGTYISSVTMSIGPLPLVDNLYDSINQELWGALVARLLPFFKSFGFGKVLPHRQKNVLYITWKYEGSGKEKKKSSGEMLGLLYAKHNGSLETLMRSEFIDVLKRFDHYTKTQNVLKQAEALGNEGAKQAVAAAKVTVDYEARLASLNAEVEAAAKEWLAKECESADAWKFDSGEPIDPRAAKLVKEYQADFIEKNTAQTGFFVHPKIINEETMVGFVAAATIE